MARDESTEYSTGAYALSAAIAATGLGIIGLGVAMRHIETPMERMIKLYREDPDLSVNVSLAPLPGGAGVGLSGTF